MFMSATALAGMDLFGLGLQCVFIDKLFSEGHPHPQKPPGSLGNLDSNSETGCRGSTPRAIRQGKWGRKAVHIPGWILCAGEASSEGLGSLEKRNLVSETQMDA